MNVPSSSQRVQECAIPRSEIEICKRDDGSPWLLGQGKVV